MDDLTTTQKRLADDVGDTVGRFLNLFESDSERLRMGLVLVAMMADKARKN